MGSISLSNTANNGSISTDTTKTTTRSETNRDESSFDSTPPGGNTNSARQQIDAAAIPVAVISSELVAEMTKWRKHMHQHPELGFEVAKTAVFVAEKLRCWGLEVHENIGETGVVAVLKRGENPTAKRIALRADMDALPIQELNTFEHASKYSQKMHACGHDGHSAMLLGAAKHLADHGKFNGSVYFIFQPDEENGRGAQAMVDDGLFERFPAQSVYGMHNVPGLDAGVIALRQGNTMAGESLFEIHICGRGGHASSPHVCIDPVVVAAQIILSLQTIVARTVDPLASAVVSVTEILTDGERNVIPSQVTIKGDCRTFDNEMTDLIEQRMGEITNGVCATYGASGNLRFSREFLVTENAEAETRAAERAALAVNGAEGVVLDCEPKSFSEDFARLQRVVDGCYVFIGNGTDSVGGCMLHNPNYEFNDEILATGAKYWCALVEQQLA